MAGRALAFSDPEIVSMATHDYVPVACDDWYQRRRQDAEGKFFRDVSDQGPRGHQRDTRQGIYVLTAGGRLLAWKNAGQNPTVMREALRDGLAKWAKLPESERAPGAVKVPEAGPLDGGYARKPPQGGLVVNVYARALEKTEAAGVADAVCKVGDGDEASRDHLWLTKDEWRALVPMDGKPGQRVTVPPDVVARIVRFHLIDNTRGEPPMWESKHVRAAELAGTVDRADGQCVLVRLEGKALLTTPAGDRGYDVALLGYVRYDRRGDRIDRFDLVALGEHWGEGRFTQGARPGRQPLGIAFELARGDKPGDSVPPQAAREERAYFRATR